jgi:hypothetical protein
MTNEKRQSTIDAINRHAQRQLDAAKPKETRAANKAPEKDAEKECLKWMRDKSWSVEIYEAKAVWSASAQSWVQKGMKAGTCDCMGSTDEGISVAVEFKAKGKLSTFNKTGNFLQRKFIVDKINSQAFACVTDSADRLETIYNRWNKIRADDKGAAKLYLISMLPEDKKSGLEDDALFDE